jgi:hypothetical protein
MKGNLEFGMRNGELACLRQANAALRAGCFNYKLQITNSQFATGGSTR